MKPVLWGTFIALFTYIKQLGEISLKQHNSTTKTLEQKYEITPTKSKQKEIIKLAAEINNLGTKERNTKKKSMKQEAGSLRKPVRSTNP